MGHRSCPYGAQVMPSWGNRSWPYGGTGHGLMEGQVMALLGNSLWPYGAQLMVSLGCLPDGQEAVPTLVTVAEHIREPAAGI